jgi:hypothetical protein
MAFPLFTTFVTATAVGVSVGFLRSSKPLVSKILPLSPPLHQIVIISYTSPTILSAQLRKQGQARHIAARLKEGTLLIGDLVIPIPSPSSMSNQQLAPQLYALPQQLA